LVKQHAQQKRRGYARRIYRRSPIAQDDANNANRTRCVQPGEGTMGKIAIAKSGESKHAVAHGEWDCEGAGYKATQQVIAECGLLELLHAVIIMLSCFNGISALCIFSRGKRATWTERHLTHRRPSRKRMWVCSELAHTSFISIGTHIAMY